MEELRSTKVLDNEIKNDARKKVVRIQEKTDESVKALLDGVADRLAEAEKAASQQSSERVAVYRKNVNASLPLVKERHRVSFIHNSIISAINAYFESAGEKKRLEVVKIMVERTKPILEGSKISAAVLGFEASAVMKLLSSVFGKSVISCEMGDARLFADDFVEGFNFHEGVILKTEDESIICRLTLDEKVKEILDDNTLELSNELFCGRLPE